MSDPHLRVLLIAREPDPGACIFEALVGISSIELEIHVVDGVASALERLRLGPIDVALLMNLAMMWHVDQFDVEAVGERLIVSTNARTQRRVADALAQLQSPAKTIQAGATDDDEHALFQQLEESRITPQWADTTIREIAGHIASQAGVTITIIGSPLFIRSSNIDETVDFTGGEMSTMAALDLLLRPNNLDFDITQGQVIIGEASDIQDRMITRIYPRPFGDETPETNPITYGAGGSTRGARTYPIDVAILQNHAESRDMELYVEVFGDADTQTAASVGKQLKLSESPGKNFKMGEMINQLGDKSG